MQLQFLTPDYSVCQLAVASEIPRWARTEFLALIRTDDEFTIIAPTLNVPDTVKSEHNFVCFRVTGELAFDIVGVISAISRVLADAKIPILSISTYNTDYFLISKANQVPARLALIKSGYEFVD